MRSFQISNCLNRTPKKKNFYHVFDFLTFQRLKNSKISILHSTIKSLNRDIQSGEVDGKEQMLLVLLLMNYLDSSSIKYALS